MRTTLLPTYSVSIPSPLVLVACAFALFLIWKMRPAFSLHKPSISSRLRQGKAQLAAAQSKEEQIEAHCHLAEAYAQTMGRRRRAVMHFVRAVQLAPDDLHLLQRASSAFEFHPRALELFLWRRLALFPWQEHLLTTREAIHRLVQLYTDPLSIPSRAQALAHASLLLQTSSGQEAKMQLEALHGAGGLADPSNQLP